MENTTHINSLNPLLQNVCIEVQETREPKIYSYYSHFLKKRIDTFKVFVSHDQIAMFDLINKTKSIINMGNGE